MNEQATLATIRSQGSGGVLTRFLCATLLLSLIGWVVGVPAGWTDWRAYVWLVVFGVVWL